MNDDGDSERLEGPARELRALGGRRRAEASSPYTWEKLTPPRSNTSPSASTRVIPPPPPRGRSHASSVRSCAAGSSSRNVCSRIRSCSFPQPLPDAEHPRIHGRLSHGSSGRLGHRRFAWGRPAPLSVPPRTSRFRRRRRGEPATRRARAGGRRGSRSWRSEVPRRLAHSPRATGWSVTRVATVPSAFTSHAGTSSLAGTTRVTGPGHDWDAKLREPAVTNVHQPFQLARNGRDYDAANCGPAGALPRRRARPPRDSRGRIRVRRPTSVG